MMQCGLFDGDPGERFPSARLASQLTRVKALMSDGRARSLREIAEAVGGSEAGVSARLRDLRKQGYIVLRKREGNGFLYMVTR